MLWFTMVGCDGGGPPPAPETTWSFRGAVFPEGPGDVLILDLDQQEPVEVLANVEPVVEDASGEPVPLVERTYLGFSYGWAPAGGFVPGDYTLVGAADFPVERQDPFTVEAFGLRAVDGADLVGRSWELVDARTSPGDLAPIGLAQGTAAVAVEAVAGDTMTFAVVYRSQDGDCVALRDEGDWDPEQGVLRWEVVEELLVLPTTEGDVELPARDLWLEVEWLADDLQRAVGQASGTVETRGLSGQLTPGDGEEGPCALASAIGFPCVACTDALETCASIQVVKGSLRETATVASADLPLCGVDRVNLDLPHLTLSCDLPVDIVLDPGQCGCSAVGRTLGLPLAALGALVVLRRRRG